MVEVRDGNVLIKEAISLADFFIGWKHDLSAG